MVQVQYVWHELNTTFKNTLTQLRGTKTAADAATLIEDQYESPHNPGASQQGRIDNANAVLAHSSQLLKLDVPPPAQPTESPQVAATVRRLKNL
jgi:hypothetical protein